MEKDMQKNLLRRKNQNKKDGIKLFAFTLDLEPDYAGCVNQYKIFEDPARIEKILSFLHSFGVKITVFVVGEIFNLYPDIIKIFEDYNCEFEVHSYSHNGIVTNLEYEIEKSKKAYFNYFKTYPRGYRAPQGKISKAAIKLLKKHKFLYDSSVFPSYYPNPFRYLFYNRDIHYASGSNIMEIPLTSITPFRTMLSLSYIKLLGIKFYSKLFRLFSLPEIICFDTHLHDFIFNESSYDKLSYFWKFIYGRNKLSGIDFCIELLNIIKQKEYQFCFMSEIYKRNKDI